MKLEKINLSQLSDTSLNELEMCRVLGGSGCCQCGCHYAGSGGGSSTSANSSANNKDDLVSDLGVVTCDCDEDPEPPHQCTIPLDVPCGR